MSLFSKILMGAILLLSASSFAMSEGDFSPERYDTILENLSSNVTRGSFLGAGNKRVAYAIYEMAGESSHGDSSATRGSIVISIGRRESSAKYVELAHDLIVQGFSPIYVIDHRGQGFSERLLNDGQKGHVDSFKAYVDDFSTFMDHVVYKHVPRTSSSSLPFRPKFLLAHSTGAAIALEYVRQNPNAFSAVLLTSPLLKLKLKDSERVSAAKLWFACHIKSGCDAYVPGGGALDLNASFEGNRSTMSEARYNWNMFLFRTFPETQLGAATVGWSRQLLAGTMKLRASANEIKTPILLLQAEFDITVENEGQNEFCGKAPNCRLIQLKASKHEIWIERDEVRNKAMGLLMDFFTLNRRDVTEAERR